MVKLYDPNKKGTIIITVGRSGSHLLGDIISNKLKLANVSHRSLTENFHYYDQSVEKVSAFYKKQVDLMAGNSKYLISQIQDFQIKVWLLSTNSSWLKDYHIIVLKRNDNIQHFFSKQILENFHATVPVHSFKKELFTYKVGNFDSLKDQKLTVSADTVFQFLAEKQLLARFDCDETVVYEDLVTWPDVAKSMYEKNNYGIGFDDLIVNYQEVKAILEETNDCK
jgi:hypothetical protein